MQASYQESSKLIDGGEQEDIQEGSSYVGNAVADITRATSTVSVRLALIIGVVFLMFSGSGTTNLRSEKVSTMATTETYTYSAPSSSELKKLVKNYGYIANYMGIAAGFSAMSVESTVSITGGVYLNGHIASNGMTSLGGITTPSTSTIHNIYEGTTATAAHFASVLKAQEKVNALTPTIVLTTSNLANKTKYPGVYTLPGNVAGSTTNVAGGTLTLDCQSASTCEFIFQGVGNLVVTDGGNVKYANVADGVTPVTIWSLGGDVKIGVYQATDTTNIVGTIIAEGGIEAYNANTGPLMSTGGAILVNVGSVSSTN